MPKKNSQRTSSLPADYLRPAPGRAARERLKEYVPRFLSNTELIAILLCTGLQGENALSMASRLFSTFNGLVGLGPSTLGELCARRELREAEVCQLLTALELGRRFVSLTPQERPTIQSP